MWIEPNKQSDIKDEDSEGGHSLVEGVRLNNTQHDSAIFYMRTSQESIYGCLFYSVSLSSFLHI